MIQHMQTLFNNDFTGCKIRHDCMAPIPMHCPFNIVMNLQNIVSMFYSL